MTTTDICELAATEPFDADTDLVFSALSDEGRLFAIARLVERPAGIALADLARDLAAWKRDADADDVPESAVESTQTKLYHVHVPKLADAGLVSYDRDSGVVALAADAETVREHVELPATDA